MIETELPCINGLKAWFPVAHVYIEPDAIKMSDGNLLPEDDARLIAASPVMLRALKAARNHLEEMRKDPKWHLIGDCPVLRQVCHAILTAENSP